MEEKTAAPIPRRNRKRILLIVLAVLVVTAAAVYFVFCVNTFSLELQLEGEPELILEYGETYVDPGVKVILRGTMLLRNGMELEHALVQTSGDPVPDRLGTYTVLYDAQYHGLHASGSRDVRILDTVCPVITLAEDDEASLQNGKQYVEAGFTAIDNFDGDITDRVVRIEEYGFVTYAVVDSSGNPAYAKREIPLVDLQPPSIALVGGAEISIKTGTVYKEPGFSATDNADGDVTESVSVEGEVLWYQEGIYDLTYTVTDSSGNQATAVRTVEVTAHPRVHVVPPNGKVIYLSFDDGPGPYTQQLLDVLDKYGVKATFFVTNTDHNYIMKTIVERGHSIGIHTVSHNYSQIYESPEAFFEDLYGMQKIIFENTGVTTTLMRFPGGSSNTISRKTYEGLMTILTEAVQDAGFQYFDWNVDSLDAGGAKTSEKVFDNVTAGVMRNTVSLVLQHDIRPYSVEAVEDIIVWGLNNGYSFEPLTPNSPTFHHNIYN